LPHSGQRPTHFDDWLPHSWQAKIVRGPDFTLAFPHRGSLWSSSRSPVTIGRVCDSCLSGSSLQGGFQLSVDILGGELMSVGQIYFLVFGPLAAAMGVALLLNVKGLGRRWENG
jgi:hypothetical protein